MPKTKISEFSATPANNTDIDSINIAEGCAPSGINDAIRELMAQLKDFQTGAVGDSFNGPIGATTASTGAFTTLSSTGNTTLGDASGDAVTINGTATFANANPTLTAGTANGVTYLNGSKVLTSGSALQFNGSQFGVNTTPAQAIDVVTDGASSIIRSTAYRASDGQAGINLRFARGSVASPTIVLTGDTIGTMEFYPYNGTNFNLQTALISAKVTGTVTTSNIPTALVFGLDAAGAAYSNEQMRLTSTGLGIGTSSPYAKIQVYSTSATVPVGWLYRGTQGSDSAIPTTFGYPYLQIGASEYASSGTAIQTIGFGYVSVNGNFPPAEIGLSTTSTSGQTYGDLVFATRSVTTNTAATERMRLDSAGNLGLGVTPSAWGNNWRVVDQLIIGSMAASTSGVGDYGPVFNAYNDNTNWRYKYTGGASMRYRLNESGHAWFTAPSGTAGNAISFTQAMTLNESGRLILGATSIPGSFASTRMYVAQATTVADFSAVFDSTTSTGSNCYGPLIKYTAASPNGTGNEFLICADSTATRFTARSNGGLANYSANNVNLSDRREKTNFTPAKSYLDVICAIPVQTFNYIDQNLEEDGGLTLGVVAQDVQAVAPELVMESNWGTQEDPKMRLSIYQTDLQYALMKCIQEQQAIIESLKARLDAANL